MSSTILHKRSFSSGSIPSISALALGELAINVHDGNIFLKRSGSYGEEVVSFGKQSDLLLVSSSLLILKSSYNQFTASYNTGSFMGAFWGDGQGIQNINTSSIVNFNSEVSRIVFPYEGRAIITGSVEIKAGNDNSLDFFLVKSGSFVAATINSRGVLKLGEYTTLPPAVEGGIVYYNSEFWVGV